MRKDPKWLKPFRAKLENGLRYNHIEPIAANTALEFLKRCGPRLMRHMWMSVGNPDDWQVAQGSVAFEYHHKNKYFLFEFNDLGSLNSILYLFELMSRTRYDEIDF